MQTQNTNMQSVYTHAHPLIYWISLSEVLRWCLVAGLLLRSDPVADASRVSPISDIIFYINYGWKRC